MIVVNSPLPHIVQITVSRPRVRNALDWETMDAFAETVARLENRPGLRAVILTGGGGTFISGGDLRALHGAVSEADGARLVASMTAALNRLAALPFPVIAAIDGAARGGGAEIALACDLRIMASDATIGFVQISLGLMPGWGGTRRLWQQVGYSRALLWLTTGAVLTAGEARWHGLVDELAPPGEALPAALELAERIAAQHPPAVRAIKRTLRNYAENITPPRAEQAERDAFPPLWVDEYHLQAVERFLQRKSSRPKG